MAGQNIMCKSDYRFQTITEDNKKVQINCNSVEFDNIGTTNCYLTINGTQRKIKPNRSIQFSHDYWTRIEKKVEITFETQVGELIITEENLYPVE